MAETRTLEEVFTAVMFGPTDREELAAWLPGALDAVRAYLQKWGAGPAGDAFVREVDGEVEAGFPATTPVGGEGEIEPSELPEGRAAVVAVGGDVAAARAEAEAHAAGEGGSPAGAPWEVLLDGTLDGRRELVLPFT
jgi:hypothetical protein